MSLMERHSLFHFFLFCCEQSIPYIYFIYHQRCVLSGAGAVGVAVADGARLWEHPWPGYPIVQPAQTADGDLLISVSDSSGTRRLKVAQGPGGWTAEERWTSIGLRRQGLGDEDEGAGRGHRAGEEVA